MVTSTYGYTLKSSVFISGAGKTTTFSILTGDISMTSGTAIIAGFDIRSQLRAVRLRLVGGMIYMLCSCWENTCTMEIYPLSFRCL